MRDISIGSNGSVIRSNTLEDWFPVLMRGGISFGECHPIKINSIIDKDFKTIPNLVGSAVVEAVKLEQAIKGEGPKLICSQTFHDALRDKHDKYVIRYKGRANTHEILWPAFAFIEGNNVHSELINRYEDLFMPAANLWKAYGRLEWGSHYYNFMKLIIRSTLHYFSFSGKEFPVAKDYILKSLKQIDIQSPIIEDLIGS